MKITKLVLGAFQTNTYIIAGNGLAVVIDPAESAAAILKAVNALGEANVTHILLTHGHFDHTSAAAELKALTDARVYIHEKDEPMLNSAEKSFAANIPGKWNPCAADIFVKDGDIVDIEKDLQIRVIHTPGHSGGSVMYAVGDAIFSGDTLFAGSVGRIDGWSGSHDEQMRSLEKIKLLEGNFRVLPGHGEPTSLDEEKRSNPFLL